MPYDLFVSYSRKDNQHGRVSELIAQIKSDYRQFAGEDLQCFFDLSEINAIDDWTVELSHEGADRLDTRSRAYIACAIHDAATTAGLACQPGPPHGQRSSWLFHGPVSLINAGFDMADKTCFLHIGPGMMISGRSGGGGYVKQLVAGFRAQFSDINV